MSLSTIFDHLSQWRTTPPQRVEGESVVQIVANIILHFLTKVKSFLGITIGSVYIPRGMPTGIHTVDSKGWGLDTEEDDKTWLSYI